MRLSTSAGMAPFPRSMVLFVKSMLKVAAASWPPIEHLRASVSALACGAISTPVWKNPVATTLTAHARIDWPVPNALLGAFVQHHTWAGRLVNDASET